MRTLVVIVDGMRPDALVKTENAKFILNRIDSLFSSVKKHADCNSKHGTLASVNSSINDLRVFFSSSFMLESPLQIALKAYSITI